MDQAGILDLPVNPQSGPFIPAPLSSGVTLDFADEREVRGQHYAFLLGETEFDDALDRLRREGVAYFADPTHDQTRSITISVVAVSTSWTPTDTTWKSSQVLNLRTNDRQHG
ncbi:MAG: hypothetical protein ACRD1G_18175, partial [Acidimicrobiales bacterium]